MMLGRMRYCREELMTAHAKGGGLECPRCGCRHFKVVYTRPGGEGAIQRRRECRHCGWRCTTREKVIGGNERP